MKRVLMLPLLLLQSMVFMAQGVPFLKNYSPDDYQANSINFDIKTGKRGTVFVANFEGLLYYDHAMWNILHTTGFTRVTVIYRDKDNVLWTGGYNYFGKVDVKPNGELCLHQIGKPDLFRGEVLEMWEKDGYLKFVVNDGKEFKVKGDEVILDRQIEKDISRIGLTDIIQTESIDERGEVEV